MTSSIYITSPEGSTGKSTVALGLVDLLARKTRRVGVFRPISYNAGSTDHILELLIDHAGNHQTYDSGVGVTYDQVHADTAGALSQIVARYHELALNYDAIVIVGSDYTDVASPTELAFNAQIAANLGSPVVLVVRGNEREQSETYNLVSTSMNELQAHHVTVAAIIMNRVDPAQVTTFQRDANFGVPAWAIPETPNLQAPTLAELMNATDGSLFSGNSALLGREISDIIVGGMTFEHILPRLTAGSVTIVPGDRADVVLGLIAVHAAEQFPNLGGIILNGGYYPSGLIGKLVESFSTDLPIIRTQLGTYETAQAASHIRSKITKRSHNKIASALGIFERHVPEDDLFNTFQLQHTTAVTPLMFEYSLLTRAQEKMRTIVLPEAGDDRILQAAHQVLQRQVVNVILLGVAEKIHERAATLGLDLQSAQIINPQTSPLRQEFARQYAQLRAHKGMTEEVAYTIVASESYFGTMLVHNDMADGMVSGAQNTTAATIKPSFEIIKTKPDVDIVSSVFFMCLSDRVLVYGDCAVNPDPNAAQLADIAVSSASTAKQFGIEQRVAMLSYSTGESGAGVDVDKVRQATQIVQERVPDLPVAGPIQYDAAVDVSVAQTKLPDSNVAGRATVFIFPDLNTGNNTYKAVQRSAGAVAIGPVLQGLNKPVNDLSRGATVKDIINTIAITAIQSQEGNA